MRAAHARVREATMLPCLTLFGLGVLTMLVVELR